MSDPAGPPHSPPLPWIQRPRFWWGMWVLWFIVLTILSSIPSNRLIQMPMLNADKFEHMGYFLLGAVLLGLGLRRAGISSRQWWWLPLVAAVVGLIDEYHQTFTPNRSGNDVGDWIADVLGGFLGIPTVQMIARRWKGLGLS